MQNEKIRKQVYNIMGIQSPRCPDGQRLAGEFINDVQHTDLTPAMCAVLNKVIRPDMVGIFRFQADAGAVVEP